MPLYEYQCAACGKRFEVIQKFSDPSPDACRLGGTGPVQRQFSSPAIQFKGTGWYITDYAKKSSTDSSSKTATGSSSSSGSSDTSSTTTPATPAASDSTSKKD